MATYEDTKVILPDGHKGIIRNTNPNILKLFIEDPGVSDIGYEFIDEEGGEVKTIYPRDIMAVLG